MDDSKTGSPSIGSAEKRERERETQREGGRERGREGGQGGGIKPSRDCSLHEETSIWAGNKGEVIMIFQAFYWSVAGFNDTSDILQS